MICPHCLIDISKTGKHHFACPKFEPVINISWNNVDESVLDNVDLDKLAKKVADEVERAFKKALERGTYST